MQFLDAEYIIDASPAQTHMVRKDTQQVITYLHGQLTTEGSYINKHYDMLPEQFTLDNNVVVSIYKKTKGYGKSDKEKLSEYYHKQYPNNDAIFRDRIMGK